MERKKRSKGRGWESCFVKKIYGTSGVEMRAYGQKLVKFCTHTHTHTRKSPLPFSKHRGILKKKIRKKRRIMERKKRSKGRGWESCYVKKFTGRLVSK